MAILSKIYFQLFQLSLTTPDCILYKRKKMDKKLLIK